MCIVYQYRNLIVENSVIKQSFKNWKLEVDEYKKPYLYFVG